MSSATAIIRRQLRQVTTTVTSHLHSSNTSSSSSVTAERQVCPFSARSQPQSTPISAAQPVKLHAKPYEDIPTPKGLPLIGTTLDLIASGGAPNVHQYVHRRHKQLGSIYREKMGNVEAVFISNADMMQKVYQFEGKFPQHMVPEPWIIYNEVNGVQRGLFFMDGKQWSDRRKSLNKVFFKMSTIHEYAETFNEAVGDMLMFWKCMTNNDVGQAQIDHLEHDLYNWSIESLGTMIFGRRLGCINNYEPRNDGDLKPLARIHDFVNCVQQIFVESANMTMIPPKLAYSLNLPVWRRFASAAGKALALARGYVEENLRGYDRNKVELEPGQGVIRQLMHQEGIDEEEIVRIITDLFIAAADTTSHATQWALYLLARNPEAQEQILREVNSVTGGEQVEEKHLTHLPYVKSVIKEALRLYPVAPFLTRYLFSDLELGGFNIPAGKLVVMSLFTSQRDEKYFNSPDQFKPERWIRKREGGQRDVINTYACLPFGLGVRSCIGRRVAEIQMQFLLSRIVQNFYLLPASDKEIGIKLRMITTPEEPIKIIIRRRR